MTGGTEALGWSAGGLGFDRDDGTPKYVAIARALGLGITDGQFAPGQPLPSQRELAETFQVTVMTVRQAIGLLADRGLVTSEQGRGTFVAKPPFRLGLGSLSSLALQVAQSGRTLRTEVISTGQVRVSPLEQSRMRLVGDRAFELVRLRYVDDEPVVLQASLLPLDVGGSLEIGKLATTSLYDLLGELGLQVRSADETLQATTLDDESARRLRRHSGSAALFSARLTYDPHGRAIVDDRALVAGDVVVISVERGVNAGDGLPMMMRADMPLVIEPVLAPGRWAG